MALTKIINDENRGYRPVLTDKLILDAKPTVNSFNAITSDAVARAVAGASGEVPAVEEGDNGKVLTAIYDDGGAAVEWADAPEELPSIADNAGKVLTVNSGATGVEWADTQLPEEKSLVSTNNTISITEGTTTVSIDVANPLPATLGTAGQVLAVNSGGTGVEWANAPSGDVVVITLTAEPTGTALEDFYTQVSTAVAANKQVVVKTIGTSVPNIRYFVLMDVTDVNGTNAATYNFNTIEIADASGTNKNIIGYRIRLDYSNSGSPSYHFSSTMAYIATGVSGNNNYNPFV